MNEDGSVDMTMDGAVGKVAAPSPKGTSFAAASKVLHQVPASHVADVPAPASAHLTWRSGSSSIDYVATASHLDVTDDGGNLEGRMFSISYVAERGASDAGAACRPVTFCYNGGPGCASIPVNFGGFGPRRVATDGTAHLASAVVEDNPYTLLPQSDLVFLDALGTGWSAVAEGQDGSAIFGVDGDADAFSRAIQRWLEENGRWGSPVYLLGESYGTVRNAVLMRILGEHDVHVAGVVMVSAIFDWVQTLPGEDLYYLGMVPTMAAAAQYFGRAGKGVDVDEWFDRAMAFTQGEYASALLQGDMLPDREEASVARRLSKLIGLPVDLIRRKHLRIELDEFRRDILADEDKVCGRLDMRFTSYAPSFAQTDSGFFAEEDAADDAVECAWTSAFRSFLHDDLGYAPTTRYLNNNYDGVGKSWNWEHAQPGVGKVIAPNVAMDIATALRRNPTCRMLIVGGRYDAATTYWNVVHDIACLHLGPELRGRIEFKRYGCGHMAYVDLPTLKTMSADLEGFYSAE
ncbi:MAG: peptidase S10 [Atopobiaceae bacterium]|nr:peptidase S10 [Atopobiaceae bacterium]MCI2173514.1 peptidase S10 [Atopobiaceae bacterium]MCI2207509.1 peptidase S10 [Atopobiaceae bacterium]